MGEVQLAVRFSCSFLLNMLHTYSRPPLPKMHYLHPPTVNQLDYLRHQSTQVVSARLGRAEPPSRKEVVEYMLDVGSHMWSMRRSKANFFRIMSVLSDNAHPDELDEEFDTFPTSRPPEIVRMRYDRLRSVAGRVQTVAGDHDTQGERFQSLLSRRDPRATTALFLIFCLAAATKDVNLDHSCRRRTPTQPQAYGRMDMHAGYSFLCQMSREGGNVCAPKERTPVGSRCLSPSEKSTTNSSKSLKVTHDLITTEGLEAPMESHCTIESYRIYEEEDGTRR
ncbi:C2 domain-containing protein [Musa troglodytarum]|uniref:C2 domain-containing protein n=1 Tax=Musa troglodytarum TaxID=320322 RepID=A0A9E7JTZ1_9LILI|nr:C2 domain-containing protein [Musa troglodytarum]